MDVDSLNIGGMGDHSGPPAHQVWSSKFRMRDEMLPRFVSEPFARKVGPQHSLTAASDR